MDFWIQSKRSMNIKMLYCTVVQKALDSLDRLQLLAQIKEHLILLLQRVPVSVFSPNVCQHLHSAISAPIYTLTNFGKNHWTNFQLYCSLPAEIQCEDVKIQNAEKVGGSVPPYGYQTTVTFKCNTGYKMSGASTLTCGVDSRWSPGVPTCAGTL